MLELLEKEYPPSEIVNQITLFYQMEKLNGINYLDTIYYKAVLLDTNFLKG